MASQFSPPPPPPFQPNGAQKHGLELSLPNNNKRPKLSPGPHTNPYISFPGSPFGTPGGNSPVVTTPGGLRFPTSSTPTPAANAFNLPQPHPSQFQAPQPLAQNASRNLMPPPTAPANRGDETENSKGVDPNDLTDIVTASGIDLRAEENYLMSSYRNKQNEPMTVQGYGGQGGSNGTTQSPYNTWSAGGFGTHAAFQGTGNAPPRLRTQKSIEEEAEEKSRVAAREYSAKKARELISPFLSAGNVRNIMQQKGHQAQVRHPMDGRNLATDPPKYYGSAVPNQQDAGVMQPLGTGIVYEKSGLEEILSLLSIAANERLRGFVEDSVGVARARRYGSHGTVPLEWKTIATGEVQPKETTVASQSVTASAWDWPVDSAEPTTAQKTVPSTNGTKPEPEGLPTPPSSIAALPAPQPTIQYPPTLPLAIRSIGQSDRKAEEARLALRKKRKAALTAAANTPADAAIASLTSPDTPNTGTSAGPSTPAADGNTKVSKKEKEKAAKMGQQTEAVLRDQANRTMSMALGSSKKYSWLTAGAAAPPGGFGTGVGAGRGVGSRAPSGIGAAAIGSSAAKAAEDKALQAREAFKRFGEFREDGKGGTKLQVRDIVVVLERNGGIDSRTLARALGVLQTEKDVA